MKSFSLVALLSIVLLGVAMAFIRPAQPVQVGQNDGHSAYVLNGVGGLLDNPVVHADPSIHPARKCKYETDRHSIF